MGRKEDTEELVKSVGDYRFTMTECVESLEYYMQLVEDQAFEITILKQRAAELEESYESMYEVERGLRKKLEAKNELR
jgi:hypothetical protein